MTNLLTATALFASALTGTLATAAPAQASAQDCIDFLKSYGHKVTDIHEKLCATGANGDRRACVEGLVANAIPSIRAEGACARA